MKKKFKKLKISIILELTSYIIIKGRILILIVKPTFSLTFHILIHNELAFSKTKKKKSVTYIDIKIVLNILKYVEICKH